MVKGALTAITDVLKPPLGGLGVKSVIRPACFGIYPLDFSTICVSLQSFFGNALNGICGT